MDLYLRASLPSVKRFGQEIPNFLFWAPSSQTSRILSFWHGDCSAPRLGVIV